MLSTAMDTSTSLWRLSTSKPSFLEKQASVPAQSLVEIPR